MRDDTNRPVERRLEIDATVRVPAAVTAALEAVAAKLEEGCLRASLYTRNDGRGLDADLLLDDSPMAWEANGLHSYITATWDDESRSTAWPVVLEALEMGLTPCTDPECEYPHHAES